MGWSSEAAIEEHNYLMTEDAEYAEEYLRSCEEAEYYALWLENTNKFTDYFSDYRLDHQGYEEFDDAGLNAEIVGNIEFNDEDLPF